MRPPIPRWILLVLLLTTLSLGTLLAIVSSQAGHDLRAGGGEAAWEAAWVERLPVAQSASPGRDAPPRLASTTTARPAPSPDRQVIHVTHLHLRVDDPAGEAAAIATLAARHGGFVEAREVREGLREGQYTAELTLRLPADQFDAAVAALRSRATRVLHEQQHANDVTDHHADLEARLRNLRHAEQELRALMTALREQADKPETIMLAYRELIGVREQIERYEAQLQRLDQQVALATVHIRLLGPDMPAHVADAEWTVAGQFSQAAWVLVRGLQVLATVGIYALVAGLPMALLVLLPVLGVARLVRRRLA